MVVDFMIYDLKVTHTIKWSIVWISRRNLCETICEIKFPNIKDEHFLLDFIVSFLRISIYNEYKEYLYTVILFKNNYIEWHL